MITKRNAKTSNVLVLGSGGREHALAWALSRSDRVKKVFVAPGNGGTVWPSKSKVGLLPGCSCDRVSLSPMDFDSVLRFVRDAEIDLTVVGDAEPLDKGIVEAFQESGERIFGPSSYAARLESSKHFAKDLMLRCGVPTADFHVFDEYEAARCFIENLSCWDGGIVIKADGLADGKGTFVCDDLRQSISALDLLMCKKRFGKGGEKVVVEERLVGREMSFFALVDGDIIRPFATARDYKRIFDNDQGPNTGGVGSIAPVLDDPNTIASIASMAVLPIVSELSRSGTPYRGVLYAGLISTSKGIRVLEYNCRFGDPETQAILPLLESDFFEVLECCAEGRLQDIELVWSSNKCATVVTTTRNYPTEYTLGLPIESVIDLYGEDYVVFHGGTEYQDGQLVTNAGRIFSVSSVAPSLDQAINLSYQLVREISFDGKYVRGDIGN